MIVKTIRKTPLALAVSTALLLASQGNVLAEYYTSSHDIFSQ